MASVPNSRNTIVIDRTRSIEQRARERKSKALLDLRRTLDALPQDVNRALMESLNAPLLHNKQLPHWIILNLAAAAIQ